MLDIQSFSRFYAQQRCRQGDLYPVSPSGLKNFLKPAVMERSAW